MILSKDQIEQPRSPLELQAFVVSVRDKVRLDESERKNGFRKIGLYKQFLEEIVPLSRLALMVYDESHRIQPVLGNQGFDAIVRGASGSSHIEYVEIANPMDGHRMTKTGEELAECGFGGLRIGPPTEELEELIPIIERTARNKARKDYSETTILFYLPVLPPFRGLESKFDEVIGRIKHMLSPIRFKARRVFLAYPPDRVDLIES